MSLPLVIELQRLAVDQGTSVVQLVRTAKLVATKLALTEALDWIDSELNGYRDLSTLPTYRKLTGECKAFNPYRGWISVQFPNVELHTLCSEARVGQSLGSMEPLLADESDHAFLQYSFEQQHVLQTLFREDMKFGIRLSKGHLTGIFDAVRNLTLDWSLQLEQAGVLGENMSFTLTEKVEAKPVTQQFFIQNAGVVGNVSDNATVTNNQQVTGSLSVESVRDLVKQAHASIKSLPADTASQVSPLLDDLDRESSKSAPDEGRLRTTLTSIRQICEGAAGNLIATGLTAAVTTLLSR
ncbi:MULTISPECIES: hypothetical protein [Cupriavidus]|uniref:AbiTii domain-containing protein n=1 Tax=Cupriavidus metallidurans TaxID=119219 RepID=A0A482INF2_9BURK|nr:MULTISPECIES: hypothetical protein [Cupriavidus]QBP08669.1 hypothetical protein DDF84_002385 [Cupriavidus metallidurans]QWC89092.1 hypothetical protein KB891_02485 [Cupriavidus metallidurans]